MIYAALLLIGSIASASLVVFLWTWIIPNLRRRRAFANVLGPKFHSLQYGHIPLARHADALPWLQENVREHGSVMALDGFYGDKELLISDPWALHQIAMKDEVDFRFPRLDIATSEYVFGSGLFHAIGSEHRRQRKMLLPLFSPTHLRKMVDTFSSVSERLRDALIEQVKNGEVTINLQGWTARTALEMIAQSGFGTSFDTLKVGARNSYIETVRHFGPTVIKAARYRPFFKFLVEQCPTWLVTTIFNALPFKMTRTFVEIREKLRQESLVAIQANRERVDAERGAEKGSEKQSETAGDDLFANLLRSYPTGSEEVSDSMLIAQMNFLIAAAMDTTSGAVARAVQVLSEHPKAQERLREEVKQALNAADAVDYDLLSRLPYLDAVCRETLRLHSPVQTTIRTALIDTVIDLGRPPIGKNGEKIKQLFIPKGTRISIGLGFTNTDREIWGEDCMEWKPERWLVPLPDTVLNSHIPGLYSKLMTFWAGPRACLGFSFSQFEMKSLLVHLIGSLKFSPAEEEVKWKLSGVMYPSTTDGKHGLPIKVSMAD